MTAVMWCSANSRKVPISHLITRHYQTLPDSVLSGSHSPAFVPPHGGQFPALQRRHDDVDVVVSRA